MKTLFQNNIPINLPLCTATVGFFDGLHRGHRFLIDELKKEASRKNQKSMLVTFATHPQKVLQPDFKFEILSTLSEKLALLEATGIDYCVVLDFTKEIARLSAREFLQDILSRQLSVATLLVGYDHRFGHNRADGFKEYAVYGKEVNMDVIQASQFQMSDDLQINSSRIRQLIKQGDVSQANQLLGRLYSFSGKVVDGLKLGRKLGFPTANLQVEDEDKLIPAVGVYAVQAIVGTNKYLGMMSIGYRPTIETEHSLSLEVHLFDFDQNIYGQSLRVEFLRKTRDEEKFASLDELIAQLHRDKEDILANDSIVD